MKRAGQDDCADGARKPISKTTDSSSSGWKLKDLDEEQLRRLLGEDGEAVRSRTAEIPVWLANWASAFSNADRIESPMARMAKDQWRDHPSLAFLTAIAPLVRQGRERLRAGVEALIAANADSQSELPFDPATIENLLFGSLPVELAGMMSRTMALELNVARVSEELTGETPDERFESFIGSLADPAVAQRIFAEYPVLARSLTETIDRRIDAGLELLERLSRDWPEIRSRLCGADDPGKLTELSFGMGDTHRGGRTVAVMSFSFSQLWRFGQFRKLRLQAGLQTEVAGRRGTFSGALSLVERTRRTSPISIDACDRSRRIRLGGVHRRRRL